MPEITTATSRPGRRRRPAGAGRAGDLRAGGGRAVAAARDESVRRPPGRRPGTVHLDPARSEVLALGETDQVLVVESRG
jgi:hypothetical protein